MLLRCSAREFHTEKYCLFCNFGDVPYPQCLWGQEIGACPPNWYPSPQVGWYHPDSGRYLTFWVWTLPGIISEFSPRDPEKQTKSFKAASGYSERVLLVGCGPIWRKAAEIRFAAGLWVDSEFRKICGNSARSEAPDGADPFVSSS